MKKTCRNLGLVFAAVMLSPGCTEVEHAVDTKPDIPETENNDDTTPDVRNTFNNMTRPDFLQGRISLPATQSYLETEYQGGSGGKTTEFPSIPYGTFSIAGERRSPYIGGLSGDDEVFMIADMYDEKLGRDRTYMLFHQATEPDRLVTSGCIAISREEYPAFKAHMREVMREYPDLVVTVLPTQNGGATFTVESRDAAPAITDLTNVRSADQTALNSNLYRAGAA